MYLSLLLVCYLALCLNFVYVCICSLYAYEYIPIIYCPMRLNIKGAGMLVYCVFALQCSITEAPFLIFSHYVNTDIRNFAIQFVTKYSNKERQRL